MPTHYDLTTGQGLLDYLAATGREKAQVKILSGGTANYVYRSTQEDGSTTIFKHAAPYLHSNINFTLDPTRMDYEANILTILSSENKTLLDNNNNNNNPSATVNAVKLLSYDQEKKLLEIEDGGSRNLKDAYTDSNLDIPRIGQDLATWLAGLHSSSKNVSLALPGQDKGTNNKSNNPVAVNIYRYSYNGLHTALEQFGYDTQLAHRINEEFGSLLSTDDECVCHGDFWPGNVLVREKDKQSMQLTIVDWEIVRRGTSATDVGQFAAEAFLLDRFRGDRGLRKAFLRAYIAAREDGETLGKAWLQRVVVHWAVHVAFWPTGVEWCDKEGTGKLVDIGAAALNNIIKDDWEKVLDSPLLSDVKGIFVQMLDRP